MEVHIQVAKAVPTAWSIYITPLDLFSTAFTYLASSWFNAPVDEKHPDDQISFAIASLQVYW